MSVMILLSRVIPQIMASSRLGEPSTARSHSLLNAIISASNWRGHAGRAIDKLEHEIEGHFRLLARQHRLQLQKLDASIINRFVLARLPTPRVQRQPRSAL